MDYHDLQKTRVNDLREMMKEKMPDVQGVIGLKKDQLVEMLAEHLGIEKPHKHVEKGLGKRKIKAHIRELKVNRVALGCVLAGFGYRNEFAGGCKTSVSITGPNANSFLGQCGEVQTVV